MAKVKRGKTKTKATKSAWEKRGQGAHKKRIKKARNKSC